MNKTVKNDLYNIQITIMPLQFSLSSESEISCKARKYCTGM